MPWIKELLTNTPIIKGMNSVTHWFVYAAVAPLVLVLAGSAQAPVGWGGLAFLALHVAAFLLGAWILCWRDHVVAGEKPVESVKPPATPPSTTVGP